MEKTLFDSIEIKTVKVVAINKDRPQTCDKCGFYRKLLNICVDNQNFVNKNNTTQIVCRYNDDAIDFKEVYNNGK